MPTPQNPQMPNDNKEPKMPKFNLNWIYIVIIGVLAVMLYQGNSNPGSFDKEVSYTEMKNYIKDGYASEVTVDKTEGVVHVTIAPSKIREVFKKGVDEVGKKPTVSTRYPSADKVQDYLESILSGIPYQRRGRRNARSQESLRLQQTGKCQEKTAKSLPR